MDKSQVRKVLHVVNISFVLPYYIGEQFSYFRKKGIQFYVACKPDDFLNSYLAKMQVKGLPVNILRKIDIWEDIVAVKKLKKYIKAEGIELVIAHTPKGGLVGIIAAYLAGVKKRVYFRHGLMYETATGPKRLLLKNIERLTARLATQVICVSPSVKQKSEIERLGDPSKNILLNKGTCNGIDALQVFSRAKVNPAEIDALRHQYNIDQNHQVIGYVGRLVQDKGIPELIAAWEKISAKYPDARLLLVGPVEERDSIDDALRSYIANEPSIIHTGLMEQVTPFYALMDVFILPSYREGFPTVVLEASAMELPVITTRATGCIDSILENETGIFTSIEPTDIADQISYYLDHPQIAKEHGKNGRDFVVGNFDQITIWNEIETKILNK